MRTLATATALSLGAFALWTVVAAQAAAPVITNITMVGATPRFGVRSDLGITNQIQYCTNLDQTNWVVLTNLLVAQSPYWFVDVAAPPASRRFYRVAALAGSTLSPTGMALIPGGPFTMGNCMSPNEGLPEELPLHSVSVSGFYMDTNLVSYAQWQQAYQWALTNGYSFDDAGSGKAGTHPVQTVNWYDVVKWCNARSQQEGLTPCYYTDSGWTAVYKIGVAAPYVRWPANGYRLPTEAEWEKAARGGASGHRFPWSNVDTISHTQANYYSSSSLGYDISATRGFNPTFTPGGPPYTSPVGYFAANGYGLYDMLGNVREWCWDWYDAAYTVYRPGLTLGARLPANTGFCGAGRGATTPASPDARIASTTTHRPPTRIAGFVA